jgi:hypothetical protein
VIVDRCGYVKSSILYKGEFAIDCLCLLFVEMALNLGLVASFVILQDWKEMSEKAGRQG